MYSECFMKLMLRLLCFLLATPLLANPVRDQHVEATLVPEVSAIVPGASFWVALKLVHDEHWHTYWINDGDSGLPTKIKWDLPDGFRAGPIVWPAPSRIAMPPLVSFGYEGEAWLLTEITAPQNLTMDRVKINASVAWLMCKEVCIPGKASLGIELPVAERAGIANDFMSARNRLPAMETDWKLSATADDQHIRIRAIPPSGAVALTAIDVFPVDKDVLINSEVAALTRDGEAYVISVPRDTTSAGLPASFRAALIAQPSMARDPSRAAIEVNLPWGVENAADVKSSAATAPGKNLFIICLFAFLGGIILNLMPCVFPVISLKILGFVKQAGDDPKSVWRHGMVFAAGVLVSFWILAGILMALRAGGAGIGWGFQLQSPEVLVVLILLFFVLALNLFGVFEVGVSLTSAGGEITSKQGWAGSFFSGFLATVIATPCTAPFMGVALGYALTQPPVVAMIVFTSLALGMAFPYLVLSRYPALLKKMPRPGAWMETMKQIMGFFLLATVIWLFWVLSAQVENGTLIWTLVALFLAGVGVWILGKWDTLARPNAVRWRARMAGLSFVVAALFGGLQNIHAASEQGTADDSAWQIFSPAAVQAALAEGRPVFIDFTAKWCLTCQVNKLSVLRTEEIMTEFRERNIALFSADWTDENAMIAAELARHGRQSVPLYLLYPGKSGAEPIVLPEILTKKIVREALNKLN